MGFETLETQVQTLLLSLLCSHEILGKHAGNCAYVSVLGICINTSVLTQNWFHVGLLLAHYALCSYWIVQYIFYIFVIVMIMAMIVASQQVEKNKSNLITQFEKKKAKVNFGRNQDRSELDTCM